MTSPRAHWLWPLALATTLVVFSGQAMHPVPMPDIQHKDKLIHCLVFGLLATAVFRAFPSSYPTRIRLYWAVALTTLFGMSDELHQGFTPGRTMDPWDWLADTVGALLATTLYSYVPLYRKILNWQPLGRRRVPVQTGTTSDKCKS